MKNNVRFNSNEEPRSFTVEIFNEIVQFRHVDKLIDCNNNSSNNMDFVRLV